MTIHKVRRPSDKAFKLLREFEKAVRDSERDVIASSSATLDPDIELRLFRARAALEKHLAGVGKLAQDQMKIIKGRRCGRIIHDEVTT